MFLLNPRHGITNIFCGDGTRVFVGEAVLCGPPETRFATPRTRGTRLGILTSIYAVKNDVFLTLQMCVRRFLGQIDRKVPTAYMRMPRPYPSPFLWIIPSVRFKLNRAFCVCGFTGSVERGAIA